MTNSNNSAKPNSPKKPNYVMFVAFEVTGIILMFLTFPLIIHGVPIDKLIVSLIGAIIGMNLIGWGLLFNRKELLNEWKEAHKLVENEKGALWIWAVALLGIIAMSFTWFVLAWPTFEVILNIESTFAFPPEAQTTVTLLKTVISWFPVIFVLGLLLWAFVASQKREEVTYPVGF